MCIFFPTCKAQERHALDFKHANQIHFFSYILKYCTQGKKFDVYENYITATAIIIIDINYKLLLRKGNTSLSLSLSLVITT